MKGRKYGLYIVSFNGDRECILEPHPSINKIRNVAQKIKQRPGRKVVISRDNVDLPGGANALDDEAYEKWLEKRQPEEKGDA